jgi:hypothetical protein
MPASIPLVLTITPVARMQNFIDGHQHGASQMLAVGTSLYYVMRDQVGAVPDNILTVWKSTDKTTWVQVAQLPAVAFQVNQVSRDCPAVLIGTVIYVADQIQTNGNTFPANKQFCLHRFDTSSDTFLADSAFNGVNIVSPNGGVGTDQEYAVSAFNNGSILLSFVQFQNVASTSKMSFQIYTPGSDTWGAAVVFLSDASHAVQQIHDSVTDLAFCFYTSVQTATVRCVTVSPVLALTDNAALAINANGAAIYTTPSIGIPVVTSAGEILIPYRFIPASGAPFLKAARATVGAAPVFSIETVEDLSTLPVNSLLQQWDQSAAPGWMLQQIQGTLYAFYDIDNGDLDNAASQSFLYYRSSQSAGVWDDPLIAFTSAIPGESLMPYGAKITGFDPVVLVGVIDPTTYPAIGSLTNFVLFGAAPIPPPVVGLEISIMLYGWKLYKDQPCDSPLEVEEAPQVKRAV